MLDKFNQLTSAAQFVRARLSPLSQSASDLLQPTLERLRVPNNCYLRGYAVFATAVQLPLSFALVVCRTIKHHYDTSSLTAYSWKAAAKDLVLGTLVPGGVLLRWMQGIQNVAGEQSHLEQQAVKALTEETEASWTNLLLSLENASPEDLQATSTYLSANRTNFDTFPVAILAAFLPEKLQEWKKPSEQVQWANLGVFSEHHHQAIYRGFNARAAVDANILNDRPMPSTEASKAAARTRLDDLALQLEQLLDVLPEEIGAELPHLRAAVDLVKNRRIEERQELAALLKVLEEDAETTIAAPRSLKEWDNPDFINTKDFEKLVLAELQGTLAHIVAASKKLYYQDLLNSLPAPQLKTANAEGQTLVRVMAANGYALENPHIVLDDHEFVGAPTLLALAIHGSTDLENYESVIQSVVRLVHTETDRFALRRYIDASLPTILSDLEKAVRKKHERNKDQSKVRKKAELKLAKYAEALLSSLSKLREEGDVYGISLNKYKSLKAAVCEVRLQTLCKDKNWKEALPFAIEADAATRARYGLAGNLSNLTADQLQATFKLHNLELLKQRLCKADGGAVLAVLEHFEAELVPVAPEEGSGVSVWVDSTTQLAEAREAEALLFTLGTNLEIDLRGYPNLKAARDQLFQTRQTEAQNIAQALADLRSDPISSAKARALAVPENLNMAAADLQLLIQHGAWQADRTQQLAFLALLEKVTDWHAEHEALVNAPDGFKANFACTDADLRAPARLAFLFTDAFQKAAQIEDQKSAPAKTAWDEVSKLVTAKHHKLLIGALPLLDAETVLAAPAWQLRDLIRAGLWNDVKCVDQHGNNLLHLLAGAPDWNQDYTGIVHHLSGVQGAGAFLTTSNDEGKQPFAISAKNGKQLSKNSSALDVMLPLLKGKLTQAQARQLVNAIVKQTPSALYTSLHKRLEATFATVGETGSVAIRQLVLDMYGKMLDFYQEAFNAEEDKYARYNIALTAAGAVRVLRASSELKLPDIETKYGKLSSYWQGWQRQAIEIAAAGDWEQLGMALSNLSPSERQKAINAIELPGSLSDVNPEILLTLLNLGVFKGKTNNQGQNITGLLTEADLTAAVYLPIVDLLTTKENQALWLARDQKAGEADSPTAIQQLLTGGKGNVLGLVLGKLSQANRRKALNFVGLNVDQAELVAAFLELVSKNIFDVPLDSVSGETILHRAVARHPGNDPVFDAFIRAVYTHEPRLFLAKDAQGRTALYQAASDKRACGLADPEEEDKIRPRAIAFDQLILMVAKGNLASHETAGQPSLITQVILNSPLYWQKTPANRVKALVGKLPAKVTVRDYFTNRAAGDFETILAHFSQPELEKHIVMTILDGLGVDEGNAINFVASFETKEEAKAYPDLLAKLQAS